MMLPVRLLVSAGFLIQAAAPAPRSWIADVKAKRATLGTAEVRIEGDVVDNRATSPTSRSGFYRLIDASDPEGVLIRSGRLPRDGGSLRVRARMASQQPPDGMLLLDEIHQDRLDARSAAPWIVGFLSLLSFLVLAVLLVRAAIAERRYKLTPPLWLLPEAGPYGKSLALPSSQTPALKYSPELEEADRVQRDQLRKRKRNLFHAVVGSFGLTGSSLAWLMITQPASAQVPAFIFIEANDRPIPIPQSRASPGDTMIAQAALDSLMQIVVQGGLRDSARRGSPGENPFQRKPVTGAAGSARTDSGATVAGPTMPLPPPPPPPPAPAPAPVPPPPPAEIPRDPEVERAAATEALGRAASRLVDAVNSRRMSDLASLVPEALAGDLGRRERFMRMVRDYSPEASLSATEGITLAEDRAEARFTVQFSWRGDFGVRSRKAGRFLGTLHREARGEWRFDGARLLDAVP